MIIAALMGLGFLTLLIAPRVHRRSVHRAQMAAAAHRAGRASELRQIATATEYPMASMREATSARDALTLRGVRSVVVSHAGAHTVVVDASDADTVAEVLNALDDH